MSSKHHSSSEVVTYPLGSLIARPENGIWILDQFWFTLEFLDSDFNLSALHGEALTGHQGMIKSDYG